MACSLMTLLCLPVLSVLVLIYIASLFPMSLLIVHQPYLNASTATFVVLSPMPMAIFHTTFSSLTVILVLFPCSLWKPVMKLFLSLSSSKQPPKTSATKQSKFFVSITPLNLSSAKCSHTANTTVSCTKKRYLTLPHKMASLNKATWHNAAWHTPCY